MNWISSKLSFAHFCPNPILPYHTLVFPKSGKHKLSELTDEELSDFFNLVQRVQRTLESQLQTDSSTIYINDGDTHHLPALHCHVLPRREHDLEESDGIYELLENFSTLPKLLDEDEKRMVEELNLLHEEIQG
ncbi:hypothetical protein P9112_010796 [Eukaryota sp. TZLM1-RC]